MVDRFLQLVYDQIPFSSFTHDQRKAWGCLSAARSPQARQMEGDAGTRGGEGRGGRIAKTNAPEWGMARAHEKLVAPPTPEPSRVKGQPLVAGSFLSFFVAYANVCQ